MKSALPIRIVLVKPPVGVTYAIQRGRGSNYAVDSAQQPQHGDLVFDFSITVADKAGSPNFSGEYVQGPSGRRFIYVDVGKYAGQTDTHWARRMIVRLDDVTWPLIHSATKPGKRLAARIPGTAADGGPNCATVSILKGWQVVSDSAGR
jgi:hypothetical protein